MQPMDIKLPLKLAEKDIILFKKGLHLSIMMISCVALGCTNKQGSWMIQTAAKCMGKVKLVKNKRSKIL